jgi:ubiquinone/menaquinone biosynthesis C-methylase UbiE
MGVDWYNSIAIRNGGYRNDAVYTVEGTSAEQIFEQELISLIPDYHSILDAGCGHGEFTIKIARYAESIVGFDNSIEMIKIAKACLNEINIPNVKFVVATTKNALPFLDGQFDLIYDRRGPTSIINHYRILQSGGTIFGIHSGALELVTERLEKNNYVDIEIREYNEAKVIFANHVEFTKFISGIPGNPDYTKPENKEELEKKINENMIGGRIEMKEYRYIWKARKP